MPQRRAFDDLAAALIRYRASFWIAQRLVQFAKGPGVVRKPDRRGRRGTRMRGCGASARQWSDTWPVAFHDDRAREVLAGADWLGEKLALVAGAV